jgi:hypothetical protein
MSKEQRKDIRFGLTPFNIKGEIVLYPNPRSILVQLTDISAKGAGIKVISELDHELLEELKLLITAWKKGTKLPVQFIFGNAKIPTHIVKMIDDRTYGILISDNKKLAALADKGAQLFERIIVTAIGKSMGDNGHGGSPTPASTWDLPEDIKNFLSESASSGHVQKLIIHEMTRQYPQLGKKLEGDEDEKKLERLFNEFFAQSGKESLFLLGQMVSFLKVRHPAQSLGDLLPDAVTKLFEENNIFSDVLKRFESHLATYLAGKPKKQELPANYKDLPPRHQLIDMVRTKLDGYDSKTFYMTKMGPVVCDYYLDEYLPRDSEIVKAMLEWDEKAVRKSVLTMVQAELTALINSRTVGKVGIDDLLRQAIYEFMLRDKNFGITFSQIADIVDNKTLPEYKDITDRFFQGICKLIDIRLDRRIGDFLDATEAERKAVQAKKDNDAKLKGMTPAELMIRYCWPTIIQMDIIRQLHREVGREWITSEEMIDYAEMGGVVLISRAAYEDFLLKAGLVELLGETPKDFFVEVNLETLHNETVTLLNGQIRKGPLGAYLYTLHPIWLRESIMANVIKQPQWNRYYILTKTKSSFQKFFEDKAPRLIRIVRENMISSAYAKAEYVR